MPRPPPPVARPSHCARCFLPRHLCLCPAIPRLPCAVPVVVLRHWYEGHRTTNTGRLVALALDGAQLIDHGMPGFRLDERDLSLPPDTCLLFPIEGSEAPPWSGGRPRCLLVPDGSWPQARHLVRRLPGLSALPRLELPPAPAASRRIRRSPFAGGRSTLEAVAAALAHWEPPETARALLELYDALGRRMDEARGPRPIA